MSTNDPNRNSQPIIVVKRKKTGGHGHHGGSWKVAYADFVTAMMAFFLLLWLLAQTTQAEREAIQGYFNDPRGSIAGKGGGLDAPGVGQIGDGGANAAAIALSEPAAPAQPDDEALREALAAQEKQSLDALQDALEEELRKADSAFEQLHDQIIIDQTALGLRVQLVDNADRPMFDSGESVLQDYARDVLLALAPRLNAVSNKLSINGHTDAVAYRDGRGYSNWELSADRANSARRSLLEGGYPDEKVFTVQGMGASVPLVSADPTAPSNRRIVILVLKKEVEESLKGVPMARDATAAPPGDRATADAAAAD